jgi:hypothetical protein
VTHIVASRNLPPGLGSGGVILSSQDIIRDQAQVRAQAVIAQFRAAIRPIYRADRNKSLRDMPTHVGTCTLFRVGNLNLVATAAHIIDQHADADLLVGGDKAPVPLTGMFSGTAAPNGNRALDKYDFSVSPVTDELVTDLGSVSYIDSRFISKGRRQTGRTQCTLAWDTQILKTKICTRQSAKSMRECGCISPRDNRLAAS